MQLLILSQQRPGRQPRTGRLPRRGVSALVTGAPLVRLTDRTFREQGGIAAATVVALLRDLDATVKALHRHGVVIGDFNDLNVLVTGLAGSPSAWIIDADSFQISLYRLGNFFIFQHRTRCNDQRGFKTIGITCIRQEFFCLGGIIGIWFQRR